MTDQQQTTHPSATKIGLAFMFGMVLGIAMLFPALNEAIHTGVFDSLNSPVSRIIGIGVLALAAITLGVYGLFYMFLLSTR